MHLKHTTARLQLHKLLLTLANRVTCDAGKECFCVLSTTDSEGQIFKVLGIEFDTKLAMRSCVQTCVPACLCACGMPVRLRACVPMCLRACMAACLHA